MKSEKDKYRVDNDCNGKRRGTLIFSSELVGKLHSKEVRLFTTCVGVRKLRTDNQEVLDILCSSNNSNRSGKMRSRVFIPLISRSDNPTFKVVENGIERRMTKREKKEFKLKFRTQKRSELSKRKQEMNEKLNVSNKSVDLAMSKEKLSPLVQDELEELYFERKGAKSVPAMLSFCMSQQASRLGVLASTPMNEKEASVSIDDDLSHKWADEIKLGMKLAEEMRMREDMREMPYRIVPEVWSRLRNEVEIEGVTSYANYKSSGKIQTSYIKPFIISTKNSCNEERSIIVQCLSKFRNLYVSCGAKFGCDWLLYDGDREERHSFAGLRYIHDRNVFCAYDLAGYVRGMNTAGKLALLCTVVNGSNVLFVDLALEKNLDAETHKKRDRKKARKEVGKHLSKN